MLESKGISQWKTMFPEDLVAKLEPEFTNVMSVVGLGTDNERIAQAVFLSVLVESDKEEDLVGGLAFEKFIAPDLLKLHQNFNILGTLCKPKVMKLVRFKDVMSKEELEKAESLNLPTNDPPEGFYKFAVYVFPVVDAGARKDLSVLGVQPTDLEERMRSVGIACNGEGHVGNHGGTI